MSKEHTGDVARRPPPRLHVDAALQLGATIPLLQDQSHYLISVLRGSIGDPV